MRREADAADGRRVRLYPTERAQHNLRQLRDIWSRLLDGVVADPAEAEEATATLRRIETGLAARSHRMRTDRQEST